MLPVICIQTGQVWLDGQVGEAVSCCSEDIGDAGVHLVIVAGVTAKQSAHRIVTHNVWQIVPEHKHLREAERFILFKRQWTA